MSSVASARGFRDLPVRPGIPDGMTIPGGRMHRRSSSPTPAARARRGNDQSDLGRGFSTRFEIVAAVTDELKERTFRLRHSVYVEDLGFEPDRGDQRETDDYDSHARAILLRHIGTGEFIACARVVRPPADDVDAQLPFERVCADTLDFARLGTDAIPRDAIAEASRLAVISKFRRREGEQPVPAPLADRDFGEVHFPRFPYMIIGLYLGIIALARLDRIRRLYLLTEPKLAEHLSRLGVEVVAVGDPVEHRGRRIPSMIDVDGVVDRLDRYVRPMYDEIVRQLGDPWRKPVG
ncbi:MAG: PEP-CTERM/exosortase system-associated acyltransferase [Betaproteobacteria bacterium]